MNRLNRIERIKSRCHIEAIAERYREVKRSGTDRFVCRCLCGEHEDRTPSFTLYANDDHFHCFACGKHGSVIDLVMLAEGVDLRQALEKLDSDGSVHARAPYQQTRNWARPSCPLPLNDSDLKLLNLATACYVEQLQHDPAALRYLIDRRSLNLDTIQKLKLGYSVGNELTRYLHQHNVSIARAAQIGLLNQYGETLRQRIVFPVLHDADVQYLIGRATALHQNPKYLGLNNTIAHKQPMVMGIARKGTIVVEGPFDLATLVQWGLDDDYLCIALLGTGERTALPLIDLHKPIYLALDQDTAGQNAAERMCNHLRQHTGQVITLIWPDAKDCGELLQCGCAGEDHFRALLP